VDEENKTHAHTTRNNQEQQVISTTRDRERVTPRREEIEMTNENEK
jgi:hypothetical protein